MMQSTQESEINKVPAHVAIIMDGNGRWARQRGLPRIAGHQQGVDAVTRVVDACARNAVRYLSLFAFSSENWGRPRQEVDALMVLLLDYLSSQRQKMLDNGIRLRVIGDLSRMTAAVQQAIAEAVQATSAGTGLTLVLALSYGGRDEILRAVQRIVAQVQAGDLDPDQLNAETFAACLDLADMPPADLMIRTSGEIRLSNFLLWQSAYTELYFTDVLWPDFNLDELNKAFADYYQRRRRFGLTDDQLLP
ncbi:isoprenyl transferase [Pelovirga terrestris]|uniref:Isoprenyl transferase n=1 Tax=Pelovirga terrestris TaxID=2771352 RepID=A0A8J6QSM1_9BACT|nr:isoprenyl transferase [Pelovirga terrestris]MBD1400945.1 isoprenyl transferase [Pelovirga terrestris]